MRHWKGEQMVTGHEAETIADALIKRADAAGADALNLRVHVPGIPPADVRNQIELLTPVRDLLRQRWPGSGPAAARIRDPSP
jgi:hypothetical protein